MNTKFEANWKYIQARKQDIINRNNKRENAKRKPHEYQMHEKVLLKTDTQNKFGESQYRGPYHITEVRDNGTVRLQIGAVNQVFDIRHIKPYYE